MVDPTGFLITGLFWATEQLWTRGREKLLEQGTDALLGKALSAGNKRLIEPFKNRSGQEQQPERQRAFMAAATRARRATIQTSRDEQEADRILKVLDEAPNSQVIQVFAEEAAKLMLFSDVPDRERLQALCQEQLYWEALESYGVPLSSTAVAEVLQNFLMNLKQALLDEEPYQNLTNREMLRTLQAILEELRPVEYDDEARYRSQFTAMYQGLDFVGIPELKERRPLTIADVFIRLRAERKPLVANPFDRDRGAEAIDRPTVLSAGDREAMSIEQLLMSALQIVVLGDPGSGKTTLLKFLAVVCAEGRSKSEMGLTTQDGTAPLPIFISLQAFAAEAAKRGEDYSLLDYFYTHAKERLQLHLQPGFFEAALNHQRCLVCLDGLDEIWTMGNRARVRDAVKALVNRFASNRSLITSRIVGYEDAPLDPQEFTHYTVLPLTDEDIHHFVTQWYQWRELDPIRRRTQTQNLIDTIDREERIKTLAQNPLLLTIITLVHRIEAELPQERVKLYDKCVTALVDTWEEVKGLSIEDKQRPFYKSRRRLLEQLAYDLHTKAEESGQVRTIKEGDLELKLTRFLMETKSLGLADNPDDARDEARAFVRLVKHRTGLLIEKGDGIFGFPHLTFQEYLTACDIEKRCIHKGAEAIWHEIKDHLHNAHWREVILLLLGGLNRYDELPTLLVERILAAGKSDRFEPIVHRHLYLAAQALGDRVEVDAELSRRVIDQLFEIVVDAPEWATDDAWEALDDLGNNQRIVAGLQTLAQDIQVDADRRWRAASILGELGQTAEAIAVLTALVQDSQVDAFTRRYAASELGKLGQTAEAIAVLTALVQDSQVDAFTRVNAANALAELGQIAEAIEVFISLAQAPQVDAFTRQIAAFELGELGQIEVAIETLVELLGDESGNYDTYSDLKALLSKASTLLLS